MLNGIKELQTSVGFFHDRNCDVPVDLSNIPTQRAGRQTPGFSR